MKKGKIADDILLDMHVELAKEVAMLGLKKDQLNELLQFINLYIDFGEPEINRTLDRRIEEITTKTEGMNLYEAALIIRSERVAEETAFEKNIAFVKKLLVKGDYSVEEIAEIAEVTIEFVLDVRNKLNSK